MKAAHRSLAALCVALALAACGAGQEESREPPPVEDTMFGDMVGAQDKARAVEDTLRQEQAERDRAMEAAEGEH